MSTALAGGKAIDLINATCSEQGLLSLYHVEIPHESTESRTGAVDTTSQRIIELYQPVLLQQYIPLSVLGDGNCFYRAVSRSICGNESFYILLRLKTAIEIITNRQYFDTGRRSYVDLINDNRILVSEYNKLVEDTITLGSYSEMVHMYALSAAIKVPIRSYYPPQLQPEMASDAYSRKVIGRTVKGSTSTNISVMWTQMCFPKNVKRFTPNHFVTLREIGNESVETVVLSDDEQEKSEVREKKIKKSNLKLKKKTSSIVENKVETEIVSDVTETTLTGLADVLPDVQNTNGQPDVTETNLTGLQTTCLTYKP